jgi:hypothetical protein
MALVSGTNSVIAGQLPAGAVVVPSEYRYYEITIGLPQKQK